MTDDIVKRLREGAFGSDETKTDCVINAHMHRAADEIERLRAELAAERERAEAMKRRLEAAREELVAEMEQNDKLRKALVGVNTALDAFWNDDNRPAIPNSCKSADAIEEWQDKIRAVLEETKGDGE